MKAVGDRVLIRREIKQIPRKVIIAGEPEFNTTVIDTLLQIGEGVPEDWPVKVDDKIVVNTHARPEGMELLTDPKEKEHKIFQGIIHYDDIAGVYDPEDKPVSKKSGAIVNEA